MKIQITLTQDNYDESEVLLVVSDETLNQGWLEIEFRGEKYSVTEKDLRQFAAAIQTFTEQLSTP